jgi:hypothetical protein
MDRHVRGQLVDGPPVASQAPEHPEGEGQLLAAAGTAPTSAPTQTHGWRRVRGGYHGMPRRPFGDPGASRARLGGHQAQALRASRDAGTSRIYAVSRAARWSSIAAVASARVG